jgi:hypothetical protein
VISQRVCERGYVVWCNMAAKWDSATTIAFNYKFENYFLLPICNLSLAGMAFLIMVSAR